MIIFLYGPETFLSARKLKDFKNKFLREVNSSGSDLMTVDAEKLTMEKINEAVAPASLFSRKRMIIIENLFLNKNENFFENLYEFLQKRKDTNDDNIIILRDQTGPKDKATKIKKQLLNFLSKQKYSQEFKKFSLLEVAAWTNKEIQERGAVIDRRAVNLLISLSSQDLWNINNEVSKLVNYKKGLNKDNSLHITEQDVALIACGQEDANIFALMDAIGDNNKALTFKLLADQINSGIDKNYLLSMMTRQFRILIQVREGLSMGYNAGKIISALKLPPFVAQKAIRQVRSFTINNLKNKIKQLAHIDYLNKTGRADAGIMIELLLAE